MPLRRYQIRNEYGLADPELYRATDKDDPEALLEGVAMAGLVGVLRQLGDLAEFAAEIFHDLHEEVMTTAARGHELMTRVQQLEAEFPPLEKALLSQTNHSSFFSNAGVVDWHPNLRSEQNLITGGDLPRFVMDSYEECRGPPRLFLLDKFDVAGAGACLKRYTDPSVFKTESSPSDRATSKIHWEKRTRKTKKKGNRRNGETPEIAPTHAKLHQLFLEEHLENNYNDAARLVKLKRRQLNGTGVDWKSGRSYMDKFLHSPSPDKKIICVTSSSPLPLNMLDNMHEDAIKILEISSVSPVKQSLENGMCSSPNEREAMLKPSLNLDGMVVGDLGVLQPVPNDKPSQTYSCLDEGDVENKLAADRMNKREDRSNEHQYDDIASEVDNYMDALTNMESETETENEDRPRNRYLNVGKQGTDSEGNDESQAHCDDSQSIGNFSLSDENGSVKRNRSNFSYSDTLSSVVDSAPSDGDAAAKLLSSDWSCEAEVMDAQSTHVHVAVHMQNPECDNSVSTSYALSKSEKFPDLEEAFADSCLTNTWLELLKSDGGADKASAQYMGPQMKDMLSQCVKSHLRLSEDEEACNRHTETTALVPGDLSLVKNDLSMESSGILPLNKLDHGCHHQDVNSDSVIKICGVSESIPDDEHNDSSVSEESQADIMGESFEILAEWKIASPEKHLNISSMAPLNTYSDVPPEDLDSVSNLVKPNDEVSKSEDGFVATKFTTENLTFTAVKLQASDAPFSGNPEVEQQSSITCTTLQVETSSKEEVQCDDRQSYGEGYHRIVNDDVRGTSTCNVDSVTDDCVYEYQLHPDQETHPSVTDELSKAVDGEDVASGVPAADCIKDVDNEVIGPVSIGILAHSQTLTDTQKFPVELENSDLKALESTDATSGEFCLELETQKQLRQPKPCSEILCPNNTNSQESEPEHWDPCPQVEQKKPVPIELEGLKDMNHQESYSCISSNVVSDFAVLQESQSNFTVTQERGNVVYSTESHSESEAEEDTHELQVVTPDIMSMQDRQKIFGNSHSEIHDAVDGSSEAEITYRTGDFTTQDDIFIREKKDAATIPLPQSHVLQGEIVQASIEHPEPGNFLEQPLESNDDLHFTELMKDFEKENLRTYQIYFSDPLNLKEYSTGASRSSPEIPKESPVSKSLPDSTKLDQLKFVYPVEPISPSLVSLPTQINLDEMPPMPPLPPMQWLGKGQPSSLGSKRELDGGSHFAFKPSLVSRTDEKAQIGLHTSHQGIVLPENVFFSAMDFKGNDSEHATGFFTGVRQPVQISHLPSTSSNFTGHFNKFPMEGSQAQNQFQTFRCTEGSPMNPCPGKEIFQNLNSSSQALPIENIGNIETSVSLQEESVPLSSPSGAEASSKVHKSSPQNLGERTKDSDDISTVPPVAECVQLHDRVLPSDAEVLDPSLPISLSEDGKPNDQGSTKLPRPRNPLIDAVAAHDKSKLRKVAERVRPQLAPKLDERDSMLEQIRTKSFNLKPTVTTRPSIQGPRTNLKVAAILEKANAIRQALAGSDEDDDADSWSDS